jgi:3-oxoacyl-[acyl-carrier-protein] synthase-3
MKNADFEGMVETSDEWIAQRTGIRQRHIAGDDETTASLGEAAARALANAGMTPDDVDLIVLATSTPNNTFPRRPSKSRTGSACGTVLRSTCRRCAAGSSMR